jgi:hypothetical protein
LCRFEKGIRKTLPFFLEVWRRRKKVMEERWRYKDGVKRGKGGWRDGGVITVYVP